MKNKIESVRTVLRGSLAAMVLASMAGFSPARAQVTPVGGIARNFTITNYKTSQPLRLSDYQGDVVLLDFWAYWCGPCQDSAPDVEANIVQYYHDNGGNANGVPVTIISIDIDDGDPVAVRNFIASYNLQLVGDDPSWVAYNQFSDGYIPHFVVANGTTNSTNHRTWEVLYSTSGYDLTAIKSAIDSLQTPAPVCVLTAPGAGTSVPGPNITLAASVTTNGKIIKAVQFYNGSTLLGSATTPPYTVLWSNAGAGSQTVSARAIYGTSSKADSAPVTFNVGTSPICALTAPAAGATVPGPNVTLAANVTSNGMRIQAVQFFSVSNSSNSLGSVSSPPYSLTWSNVTPGSETVFARAFYGGSFYADSPTVNFTVSAALPMCTVTAPAAGATIPGSVVSLSANVVSNGLSIQGVYFYEVINFQGTLIGSVFSPPYNLTWSNVAPGSKTVMAQALYGDGLFTSSPKVSFTVAGPPIRAAISLQGGNVSLSWNGGPGQFQVQTRASLANPGWQNLGAVTTATNLTLPPTNPAAFYRVQRR